MQSCNYLIKLTTIENLHVKENLIINFIYVN